MNRKYAYVKLYIQAVKDFENHSFLYIVIFALFNRRVMGLNKCTE